MRKASFNQNFLALINNDRNKAAGFVLFYFDFTYGNFKKQTYRGNSVPRI